MADAVKAPAPPAPPPSQPDDEVAERRTIRDYYIILRERLWIALPLALLISVAYCYKKMQVRPLYFAVATMQFEKPENVVSIRGVIEQSIQGEVDLNTNLELLRSGILKTRVKESFTPDELKILQRRGGDLLGTVVPYSSRNSLLIQIQVTHDDPEGAALVANRYVDQFYEYLRQNAGGINADAIKSLQAQLASLQKEYEDKEQEAQAYMKRHNLISLASSTDLVTEALKKTDGLRASARLDALNLDEKIRQIESYQKEGKNLLEIVEISTNPQVAAQRAQRTQLEQELNNLAERYLELHPKMIEKTAQLASAEAEFNKAVLSTIADLRARAREAHQRLDTYQAEFDKAEAKSIELRDRGIEYGTIRQQADAARANYLSILTRLNELRTKLTVEKVPIRPLDRAYPPGKPANLNKSDIIKTGSGIFVLVFLGVAIGLSFIDDRIKSAWDVESFIGANLLGIIPDLSSMKDDEKYTLLLDNKQSPGVEAFLSVYSSIKIHSKLDFPKSILVTSTIPGEGKTLISCNVAGSFARHGKKTLLIDCDLRRPMLHRHFKQQNTAGLLPWFENGAIMEGDLATNPWLGISKVAENLSLLSSGGRSKTPTELLEHPLFGQLLERLKREYDLIIVDSPPLGAVTDSLLIAERIDEVVYVCRFNRAYRKHIRLYMRTLRNGKNEVLGIVLNGLSPRRIEYYSNYRYYRSYKKYYGAQT
jgi:succinoglycan biosynthesis transport protein ExoP